MAGQSQKIFSPQRHEEHEKKGFLCALGASVVNNNLMQLPWPLPYFGYLS